MKYEDVPSLQQGVWGYLMGNATWHWLYMPAPALNGEAIRVNGVGVVPLDEILFLDIRVRRGDASTTKTDALSNNHLLFRRVQQNCHINPKLKQELREFLEREGYDEAATWTPFPGDGDELTVLIHTFFQEQAKRIAHSL